MTRIILIITLLFTPSLCMADSICEKLAKNFLQSKGDQSNSWIGAICKRKPDDTGKFYLILNQQILLIESDTGQVISQGEIGDTAESIVSIDTGKYWLSKNTKAFGIRSYDYERHDHSNQTEYYLNLYILEGKNIRKIIENLSIGSNSSSWECSDDDDNCTTNEPYVQQITIHISKTSHNGFADLILMDHGSKIADGLLIYDGTKYVIPANLRLK